MILEPHFFCRIFMYLKMLILAEIIGTQTCTRYGAKHSTIILYNNAKTAWKT